MILFEVSGFNLHFTVYLYMYILTESPETCYQALRLCKIFKRGSCMVWEINMGVCPRLDFENIKLFNCLGYNFNIYGAFEFLCNSIANL